jgi:hypothetical protein
MKDEECVCHGCVESDEDCMCHGCVESPIVESLGGKFQLMLLSPLFSSL